MPLAPLPAAGTRPYFRPVARELGGLVRHRARVHGAVYHQAQVRDAVGAPPLGDPRWLHAVLLIALRGLPHAYRDVPAAPGKSVTIEVAGAAGGVWTLRREEGSFRLWAGQEAGESARVAMSDDTAWRLLFDALPPGSAETCARDR